MENCGFWESIPLWAVTLIGEAVYYGAVIHNDHERIRTLFKIYMYSAIAPIPLSTFAGQPTENVGKTF